LGVIEDCRFCFFGEGYISQIVASRRLKTINYAYEQIAQRIIKDFIFAYAGECSDAFTDSRNRVSGNIRSA